MNPKERKHAHDDDCVKFFNLFASLPEWTYKSEFVRQIENKYNQRRVEEIHLEDLLKIQTLDADNDLTMDQATELYYESKEYEMATPTYQYVRGNFLVATNEEYNALPTYMRDLHDYYMAQAIEMEQTGFEVIIRSPHVFQYTNEEKRFIGWECLFQLYQRRSLDTQILTLWTI